MKRFSDSIFYQITLIAFLTVLIRLVLSWVFGAQVADVEQFHWMASIIARAENIFDTPGLFHYTPVAMFLPYWCLQIAKFTELPFHFVIKWPTILADAGIAAILCHLVYTRIKSPKKAFSAGLIYAFNPVSLLITCFHGSYNIIYIFFALAAYALVTSAKRDRYLRLSALCLGLSIGIRGFALLFLPFLLFGIKSWRKRILYVGLAGLPSIVTLIPALMTNFEGVWRDTFSYSGVTDYGWIAIVRYYWVFSTGNFGLPGSTAANLLSWSKWLFLIVYSLFVVYFWLKSHHLRILDGILIAILLFFVVYGGISSQYLAWIVPFAILASFCWQRIYAYTASFALICFYLYYFPAILFGHLQVNWPELNPNVMLFTLISGVIFWLFCLIWAVVVWGFPRFMAPVEKPDGILESGERKNGCQPD